MAILSDGAEKPSLKKNASAPKPPVADSFRQSVREAKRRIEAQLIIKALEKHRWNRRLAAEALQISYRSLMYKMKNCNLRDDAASGRGPES